ncbi:sulfotransferase [Lysobacter sp. A3-1-A15]
MRAGDLPGAVAEMGRMLELQPGFVPAMVQRALWLLSLDRYREARSLACAAAAALPRSPPLALETVRLLRRFEEVERIERVVHAVDWSGSDAGTHAALAAELAPIALYKDATRALDQAEALLPADDVRLLGMRATLKMVEGEAGTARHLLERLAAASISHAPRAQWLLSLQPADHEDAQRQIAAIERRLEAVPPGGEAEVHLAYALHNRLHGIGDYEASWAALVRACRVKRALLQYDASEQGEIFERLMALPRFTMASTSAARQGPIPVFVVGMHRSGTTLLERMLAGHRDVIDGGESYAVSAAIRHATDHYSVHTFDLAGARRLTDPGLDLGRVRRDVLEYMRWKARGHACVTEKLPSNFLHLGVLLAALPEARVLHMRRNAMDTCFSNLRTLFSIAAPYSYDQHELAEYYLGYRRLMDHWSALWPGRILDVKYECLVEDPDGQGERILEFCGLSRDGPMLGTDRKGGAVATASLADVRAGIQRNRGGVWRHYQRHLSPLSARLESDAR